MQFGSLIQLTFDDEMHQKSESGVNPRPSNHGEITKEKQLSFAFIVHGHTNECGQARKDASSWPGKDIIHVESIPVVNIQGIVRQI